VNGADLRRLFQRLAADASPVDGTFAALEVPRSGGHMAFISAAGTHGLLLVTSEGGARPPRIRLSGLDALFGVRCTLSVAGAVPEERRLTVLSCTADANVRPFFAEFSGTLLRLIGPSPTMEQASLAIARFAALLSSLTRPSRQSVTGLIGELMILLLSSEPALAIACWRRSANDRFDFIAPDARVECKAASPGLRVHSFSWEQCNPPDGPALVCSLFVEETGGGTSVRELLDRIEARLSAAPEAAVRLREIVVSTMGEALSEALDARFDEAACRSSHRWFNLRDVPAIRGILPGGVGSVRFTSDLSSVDPIAPTCLAGTGLAGLVGVV